MGVRASNRASDYSASAACGPPQAWLGQPTTLGPFGSANVMHPVDARRVPTTATTQPTWTVLSGEMWQPFYLEKQPPKGIFTYGCGLG